MEWNWWRVLIVAVAVVILLGLAVLWVAIPAAMRSIANAAA